MLLAWTNIEMNPKPETNIVILTGAGISAESGLPTFRGEGGLYRGYRAEEVATPQAFERDPDLVHSFYNMRRQKLLDNIQPNAAHLALAKLQNSIGCDQVTIVTQNVDNLHELGGATDTIHIHGELLKSRCTYCLGIAECKEDLSAETICVQCGTIGSLRPDIVWFGETPMKMDLIQAKLESAELFVSIGTSGAVYPAAGFVELARDAGAKTIELNIDPSATSNRFDECRIGPASQEVPKLVEQLLN
jgi:NAD-dependent deacetylase